MTTQFPAQYPPKTRIFKGTEQEILNFSLYTIILLEVYRDERPKKKVKKISKIEDIQIFTDSEWTSKNINVSVQLLIKFPNINYRKFIVINEIYKDKLNLDLIQSWSHSNDCIVEFLPITEDTNVIHYILEKYYLQDRLDENVEQFKVSGKVHIFYSFQDLGFAFG
jgi:hypothetical protein